MKKKLILALTAAASALPAAAIECPSSRLSCETTVVREGGTIAATGSAEAVFIGLNRDEPSEPADECEAELSLPSLEEGVTLRADVQGTGPLTAFVFAYKADYGALGNQASFEVRPGLAFTFYYKNERLDCVLK